MVTPDMFLDFIFVNFEHFQHINLMFLVLTVNMIFHAGKVFPNHTPERLIFELI